MKTEDRHMHAAAESEAWDDAHAGHQALWPQMVAALAAIDEELGLPEDGCNSTGRTLAAVRELKAKAELAQALARTVMADQTSHDTRQKNAMRFCMLMAGTHRFGVFVCDDDGHPDDSISESELIDALDAMLVAPC